MREEGKKEEEKKGGEKEAKDDALAEPAGSRTAAVCAGV